MKFIINFIVAYLAISLTGFFLWEDFLLADVILALMLFDGDLEPWISGLWLFAILVMTGKIIVCLVIAGAVLGLQGVKKNE